MSAKRPVKLIQWVKIAYSFLHVMSTRVTYGKGLLVNMQKLFFGAYLPDFTSERNENWLNYTTFGA